MQRVSGWGLLRMVALPRAAPAVLLAAWMVATSAAAASPWAGSIAGCLAAGTLLVADRWPFVPLVATAAGMSVAGSLGGLARDDAWLALLICSCFCVGRFGGRVHQRVAGAVVVGFVILNIADDGVATTIGDVAFPLLFTGGPWLLGLSLQTAERRVAAATDHAVAVMASSAAAVDRATTEERLRIARDLHDVVAHNISALSLQAQTVRRRAELGEPVDIGELRAIEQSAQAAMTDLRQLLGVLRPRPGLAVAGPHEGLAQLSELVATAERVGQRVDLAATGEARMLPPALSLAAYRIVQEALANARRHAPGQVVRLQVDWSATELRIRVDNPCDPPWDGRPVAPGNGTTGMTERARLYGGDATAGPVDRGWSVRARLPIPALLETSP